MTKPNRLALAFGLALFPVTVNAQAAPKACSLLSAAQVQTLVWRGQRPDGPTDEIPLAAGAGSACSYASAHQVIVYTGPRSESFIDTELKMRRRDKEPRHPVPGVGDRAYVLHLAPQDEYQLPAAFLVARVGSNTLAVVMQAPSRDVAAQAMQAAAIEVAKAAAAKLKGATEARP
jgi:hypothetical protein